MYRYIYFFFILLSLPLLSQNSSFDNELRGKWAITFESKDIGQLRTFLTFQARDTNFTAYTRKNADRIIIGPIKSMLGRIFTKSFKNGSLINITDGCVKKSADTLILKGIFRSAIGNYYFDGIILRGALEVSLRNGKKQLRGTIRGNKVTNVSKPSDYTLLVDQVIKTTKEKIYSNAISESKSWKKFEKQIRKTSRLVEDDLEMEFAFFYYKAKLPFSHYSLIRLLDNPSAESPISDREITLKELSHETMYMNIPSFSGSALEMDSVFALIKSKAYKNLIVDLRNNSGGSIEAGMKFATNVSKSTFYGGVFLTQRWFKNHQSIPSTNEYDKLTPFTAANFNLIIEGIHSKEALCIKVIPEQQTYSGQLFILTSKITASTCEPIVYALKQQKRAVIVGEKTAGAMLNGEFFEFESNFMLVIPTADYYTSDGYKIDQNGVEPTITVKQEEALDYVIRELIK